MTDGSAIHGQCVCGKYQIDIPKPEQMNLCHCVDCRRWSGTMHSAHMMVKTEELKMTGPPPRTHTVKGEKGMDMTRAWCDGCGSGLWIKPDSSISEGMKFLKAGLFDPGSIPHPTMETFTMHREPWETPVEGAKQYERNLDDL